MFQHQAVVAGAPLEMSSVRQDLFGKLMLEQVKGMLKPMPCLVLAVRKSPEDQGAEVCDQVVP